MKIESGAYDAALSLLYPRETAAASRNRYFAAVRSFASLYGDGGAILVSAPGRTEIGGNHTDHQRGCVLAAAVDLDILCAAAPRAEPVIRIHSEGHGESEVRLNDLTPQRSANSPALIRGVAEWFSQHGYPVGGFNAFMTSRVPSGSGLSSSAAFEVAVGQILNHLYGGGQVSPTELALAGRYAENVHLKKPSGLMDQMASAEGGAVVMDFMHPERPRVEPVAFNVAEYGYNLCVVDTGGSHADLTGNYADITCEMRQVALYFGKQELRDVDETAFHASLPVLRQTVGDRALLRAIHFFSENRRVADMASALRRKDILGFLDLVRRSGDSSWRLLQNVALASNHQPLALALAVSETLLSADGAWRVHGGGFAGTIQAFVPDSVLEEYVRRMSDLFGTNACHFLAIRPLGVHRLGE